MRVRITLIALLSVLSLTACSALRQTPQEVVVREPGHRLLGSPQPLQAEAAKDLEFAWLSEAAYGNTVGGKTEKSEAPPAQSEAALAASGCPVSQDALRAHGWNVWPDFPNDGLSKRIDAYHLRVEVWTRADPPAVAVAFGGTVFNNQNDWTANLRWFLPKWFQANHVDEYSAIVQIFGPAFVSEFKRQLLSDAPEWKFLKQAKIYSTGHSLGGGLAQQFAYALPVDSQVPRVAHVFAFDPSPVTGFYSVDESVRDVNRQSLFIDRIYERGEVLAVVRSLTSVLVQPSETKPTIRGVRYSLFYPADPVAGHSMKALACKLNAVVPTKVNTGD